MPIVEFFLWHQYGLTDIASDRPAVQSSDAACSVLARQEATGDFVLAAKTLHAVSRRPTAANRPVPLICLKAVRIQCLVQLTEQAAVLSESIEWSAKSTS